MSDTPTPEPTAPPEAPPEAPADAFDDFPADQAVFDRGYVEKVRSEAQRYRDEARSAGEALSQYEDVFGVYEPNDRDTWLEFAETWAHDPAAVAVKFREIADAVLGPTGAPPDSAPAQPTEKADGKADEPSAPLTRDDVEQLIQQSIGAYDQELAEDAAVEDVKADLRELGFDIETRDGFMVLWTANNETDGDLEAAAAKVKADKQKIIDDYVAGHSGSRAALSPQAGVVAQTGEPIKNLDDARKATEAFLRNQRRDAG